MSFPLSERSPLQLLVGGLIFVGLSALVFWPLEELLDHEHSKMPTFKDLAMLWFYQSYGLWLAAGILFEIAYVIRSAFPSTWTGMIAHLPFWVQVLMALGLAEVWVYVFHRLSHKWPFLWQFHRVHHSLEEMTWSASSRQHPVDFLLIIVGANLPAMILGIDLRSIAAFIVLERFYTVMLHSNLNLDWGWFSRIIASPRVHAAHHDPKVRGNYAGILTLLDVVGRSYQPPREARSNSASEEREYTT